MELVDNREFLILLKYGNGCLFLANTDPGHPEWTDDMRRGKLLSFMDALELGDQLVQESLEISVCCQTDVLSACNQKREFP